MLSAVGAHYMTSYTTFQLGAKYFFFAVSLIMFSGEWTPLLLFLNLYSSSSVVDPPLSLPIGYL